MRDGSKSYDSLKLNGSFCLEEEIKVSAILAFLWFVISTEIHTVAKVATMQKSEQMLRVEKT